MTRHELLHTQTTTPPSQPSKDLAPVDGGIVITFLLVASATDCAASLASASLHAAQAPPLRHPIRQSPSRPNPEKSIAPSPWLADSVFWDFRVPRDITFSLFDRRFKHQ